MQRDPVELHAVAHAQVLRRAHQDDRVVGQVDRVVKSLLGGRELDEPAVDRPRELGVAQVRTACGRVEQGASIREPPGPHGQAPRHDRVVEQRDALDDGSIALVKQGPGLVPSPELDERSRCVRLEERPLEPPQTPLLRPLHALKRDPDGFLELTAVCNAVNRLAYVRWKSAAAMSSSWAIDAA